MFLLESLTRQIVFAAASAVFTLAGVAGSLATEPVAAPTRHGDEYLHDLAETEKAVVESERALKAPSPADPKELDIKQKNLTGVLQFLAVDRAKLGDASGAMAAVGQVWRYREQFNGVTSVGDESADLRAIDRSHAEDAIAAIVNAARSRQVVILNEAHHVAFDRIFAMHLAHALRKEGFEYLACETFFINDEHVLNRGYVVRKTGVYSREATYAKFLTDALAGGWKFVSYEPDGPSNMRESNMAKNLVNRIFTEHPKAKVFVYAGYSHAKKIPVSVSDDDDSKLAAQLQRLTGINPLTINQTTLFSQYNGAQQTRYYKRALGKLKTRSPVVLINADGSPVKLSIDNFAYDFEVVHPAYMDDPATHRPEWLSKDFAPHAIPSEMLPTSGPRAIYVYRRDTAPDAVPLDVVVLKPGAPAPKLMLPPGDFVFEYED